MVQRAFGVASFSSNTGGPQHQDVPIALVPPFQDAIPVLTGFNVEFTPRDDHNFGQLYVDVSLRDKNTDTGFVVVRCTYGLRDWSDEFDDKYDGTIRFVVIGIP